MNISLISRLCSTGGNTQTTICGPSIVRFGFLLLIRAQTFVVFPGELDATVAVGLSVTDSLGDTGVVEPVHYSRRYGWHYGMRNYSQEHRDTCQRTREDGYWGGGEVNLCGALRRRLFGAGGRPVEN